MKALVVPAGDLNRVMQGVTRHGSEFELREFELQQLVTRTSLPVAHIAAI
jgi:hypothetical protein